MNPVVLRGAAPIGRAPSTARPAAAPAPADGEGPRTAADNERQHILRTLEQTRSVIEGQRGAAKILGLHPNTLRSRMKKLGAARGGIPIS